MSKLKTMAYSVALNWVGRIRPAASGANWATVGQFIDPKFRYSTVSSNGVVLCCVVSCVA